MMFSGALFLFELVLLVYCAFDIATTPAKAVRRLPKTAWLLVVLVLPLFGGISWLVWGRPAREAVATVREGAAGDASDPRLSRPARPASRAVAPDDDEDFLRMLDERARAQRRAAEEGGASA